MNPETTCLLARLASDRRQFLITICGGGRGGGTDIVFLKAHCDCGVEMSYVLRNNLR
jgi:hypothetical protein